RPATAALTPVRASLPPPSRLDLVVAGSGIQVSRRSTAMNVDRIVMAFAGAMVLASVLLAWLVSPWWLLLAAFVGLNLLQASITGFCPAAMLARRLGARPGCAFQ